MAARGARWSVPHPRIRRTSAEVEERMTTNGHDLGYQGTTVAITGVASGIGEATARLLGELGAEVIGLDIATPQVHLHRFIQFDLRDEDSIAHAAASVGTPLDALFHCAGTTANRTRPRRAADRVRRICASSPNAFALRSQRGAPSRASPPRRPTPGSPNSNASGCCWSSRRSARRRRGVAPTSAPMARTTPWPRVRSAPTPPSAVTPWPVRASASTASVPARRRPR